MKETELAARVVEWLQRQHWTVYQEVQGGRGRHDIVATRNGVCWVVECKMSLTFKVLEQAHRAMAHFRSVAVPKADKGGGRAFAYKVAERFGIGILEVGHYSFISEMTHPTYLRLRNGKRRDSHKMIKRYMLDQLTPEQKKWGVAGAPGGMPYWTPYKQTIHNVKVLLLEKPGLTIKDIIAEINSVHHYSNDKSALQCLRTALGTWESEWCLVDATERTLRYSVKPTLSKEKLLKRR